MGASKKRREIGNFYVLAVRTPNYGETARAILDNAESLPGAETNPEPRRNEEPEMTPTEAGYYQDADTMAYVTKSGAIYIVQGPDDPEPVWRQVDELSEDAERANDQGEHEAHERVRVAYGIEA